MIDLILTLLWEVLKGITIELVARYLMRWLDKHL